MIVTSSSSLQCLGNTGYSGILMQGLMMLHTLVHSQDTIYLGKGNAEAYSHATLPYPLQENSAPSSLHQQQLQPKPAA